MTTLKYTRRAVFVDTIDFDADTQVREAVSEEQVASMAESLAEGRTLGVPKAIALPDGRIWPWDGWHRIRAHIANRALIIDMDVADGTEDDARFAAASANVGQDALPRTRADKQRAIRLALSTVAGRGLSNYLIAKHVGVSEFAVRQRREEIAAEGAISSHLTPATRLGRDGKTYPVSGKPLPSIAPVSLTPEDMDRCAREQQEYDAADTERRSAASKRGKAKSKGEDEGGDGEQEEAATPEVILDGAGHPVPDSLRDVFADRALQGEIDRLEAARQSLDAPGAMRRVADLTRHYPYILAQSKDGAGFVGSISDAARLLEEAVAALRAGLPFAVCPRCQGKGGACDGCRKCGHVPEWRFDQLRAEGGL